MSQHLGPGQSYGPFSTEFPFFNPLAVSVQAERFLADSLCFLSPFQRAGTKRPESTFTLSTNRFPTSNYFLLFFFLLFSFLFSPPRRNFFRIFENYGRFLFYLKRELRGIFVKLRSKDFFVSNVNSRLSENYNNHCFFSSSTMRFPWNFSQL